MRSARPSGGHPTQRDGTTPPYGGETKRFSTFLFLHTSIKIFPFCFLLLLPKRGSSLPTLGALEEVGYKKIQNKQFTIGGNL
jgi:hypothetical protein